MTVLDLFLDTDRIVPADYMIDPIYAPGAPIGNVTTQQLYPLFRRPDASGEHPAYEPRTAAVVDEDRVETVRIPVPAVYGTPAAPTFPARPRRYRGQRRLDRSRVLLLAALGGEGGSL